jgi:ribosomal protein S18 acetylase RimI-like enzyme
VCIEGAAEFASFNLAIRTRWQGRGLGTSLVKSAEEWVRRRGLLFLIFHVAVRNDRAFAFYERLGYTVCGDVVAANKESGVIGDYYAMGRMLDADEVALA